MATAAPHVKLLRQLASAKDDYLSGAFDVSWDGARATLYLVFGRPSHAVFEINQAQIEGEAAIDALLAELPKVFAVSDWRRAMSPRETLSITIDELAGPFVRLAGSYADDPIADESPEWWSAIDDSPDLPFGLADFPLMPGGRPLWVEASPDEVRLAERLSELPPSILVLTGAKLRAAAVVSGGDLIDAVWIDADDHARGETAGMALLGATKGSLAGYALDDPRVAEALTMIWRLPLAVRGVDLAWLDPASMLAAFHADGLDRVLVIDAPVRGIALFSRGGLVAVYSETQRSAVASPERLRSLLSQARGRLTVMERKPRPLAADATPTPATAYEFFEVAPPETPATPAELTEAEPVLDAQGAEAIEAVPALDAVGAEPAVDAVAPPPPPSEAVLAGGEAPPPPPPPAAESLEPSRPARRSRWGFRRNRRSRQEVEPAEDIAAVPSDASDAAGAPTAGWSIRQPNVDPAPVWHRALDAGGGPPINSEPVAGPDPATQPAADHETHPPDIAPDEPAAEPAEPPSHDTQPLDFASDQPVAEPAAPAASDDWLSSSWLDDVVDGGAGESITEADAVDGDAGASMTEGDATAEPDLAAPADGQPESGLEPVSAGDSEASEEPSRAVSIFRTPGPWVWPLAEPEQPTGVANGATSPPTHPSDEPDAQNLEPASAGASGDQDDPPVLEGGAEPEFFHRDEPVGSKYVDFDEVRDELVRIGVVWLGEANAVPVTALLNSTRSTIDDFVAIIDTIRGLHLEGQDPASIQAMAREMHQQAAERLSGA